MSEGAKKNDNGKVKLTYVSKDLMEAVAIVRDFGSKTYGRDNWKRGFEVTRSLDACLRHIMDFLAGYTNDFYPDRCEDCRDDLCAKHSKLPNLWHAACALEHAIYDMNHHPENDNRYIAPENNESEPEK